MSINIDAPSVANEDEALLLMMHHLKIAAMYFEATPSSISVMDVTKGEFSQPAIIKWLSEMEKLYPEECTHPDHIRTNSQGNCRDCGKPHS